MESALTDEQEALNAIYGEDTLVSTATVGLYVLKLPDHDTTLKLEFPANYPEAPVTVLGTESSGEHSKRGEAARIVETFREAVGRLFEPGEVVLFNAIEDITASLNLCTGPDHDSSEEHISETLDLESSFRGLNMRDRDVKEPPWSISDVVIELKSVFVARCAPVSSPAQAKQYLHHLLDTDKKVAKATHNITAWRIKGEKGAIFQDCDDDGETAAGGRVLHLMQLMDLWDCMVVVTRWYGGQKLGPARFGIINSVARDAFVKAGLVQYQEPAGSAKKTKR